MAKKLGLPNIKLKSIGKKSLSPKVMSVKQAFHKTGSLVASLPKVKK